MADWGQKVSAAIGFIKATENWRKKPHIIFKKPPISEQKSPFFCGNVLKKPRYPYETFILI
jgi:hypothetical protein